MEGRKWWAENNIHQLDKTAHSRAKFACKRKGFWDGHRHLPVGKGKCFAC
jgi:hypothetical protein